jgi:hypothetical protein
MPDDLKINLSRRTVEQMRELSERSGYSMKELLIVGLVAAKVILEVREKGNVLVEATPEGKAVAEYKFPEPRSKTDDITRSLLSDTYSLSLERAIADLDPDRETPSPPVNPQNRPPQSALNS